TAPELARGKALLTSRRTTFFGGREQRRPRVVDVSIRLKSRGGRVLSTPVGIDCGSLCETRFAAGTHVKLVAKADPGYVFVGWSGGCSGKKTCLVTSPGTTEISASFAQAK